MGGGSSHTVEYRTDPNLVNQINGLTKTFNQQQKQHEKYVNEVQDRLRSLKEEGLASAQEAKELKKMLDDANKKEAARLEELEKLRNYPPARFQLTDFWKRKNTLHIGVVGGAGTGKSTFINTIRGMRMSDPGGASVNHGVECTMEETPYSQDFKHNGNVMHVVWWDLPGGGTDKFPWKTYLRDFGIRYFNFVIQFTVTRFTEGDAFLMHEMDDHNVPHATVRNKIDEAINSANMEGHNVDTMISEVRHDFSKRGVERVFLISSPLRNRNKHDFPSLCEYIRTSTKGRIDEGIDFQFPNGDSTFMDQTQGAEEVVEFYNFCAPEAHPRNSVIREKLLSPLLTIGEINFFGTKDLQLTNGIWASSVCAVIGIRCAFAFASNSTLHLRLRFDFSNANRTKIVPFERKRWTTYLFRKLFHR